MKLHFFILAIFIFLSCNFSGNNNASKTRATELLENIMNRHTTLLPKINASIARSKISANQEVSTTNIELNAIDYTIESFHQDWTEGFDNFEKQKPFLNYDLQIIRLEQLEKSLDKLDELVERAKGLEKE